MKYLWIVALFLIALTVVPEVSQAQELSRKERKRLKKEQKRKLKELKKMDPSEFSALQEKQQELKQQAASLESELNTLKGQADSKDSEIRQLNDQIRRLENQLSEAKAEIQAMQEQATQNVPLSNQYDEGLVFRVQIGAYRDKTLEPYLANSETLNADSTESGLQTYTLGNFRDYWEADKFKKYLRAMGVRDAWIVPYRDGTRVELKEVLESLRSNQQNL
ncbi:MAG: Ezrin/radixin/moesin family protein [Cyclobacteriaceae bacterium]